MLAPRFRWPPDVLVDIAQVAVSACSRSGFFAVGANPPTGRDGGTPCRSRPPFTRASPASVVRRLFIAPAPVTVLAAPLIRPAHALPPVIAMRRPQRDVVPTLRLDHRTVAEIVVLVDRDRSRRGTNLLPILMLPAPSASRSLPPRSRARRPPPRARSVSEGSTAARAPPPASPGSSAEGHPGPPESRGRAVGPAPAATRVHVTIRSRPRAPPRARLRPWPTANTGAPGAALSTPRGARGGFFSELMARAAVGRLAVGLAFSSRNRSRSAPSPPRSADLGLAGIERAPVSRRYPDHLGELL